MSRTRRSRSCRCSPRTGRRVPMHTARPVGWSSVELDQSASVQPSRPPSWANACTCWKSAISSRGSTSSCSGSKPQMTLLPTVRAHSIPSSPTATSARPHSISALGRYSWCFLRTLFSLGSLSATALSSLHCSRRPSMLRRAGAHGRASRLPRTLTRHRAGCWISSRTKQPTTQRGAGRASATCCRSPISMPRLSDRWTSCLPPASRRSHSTRSSSQRASGRPRASASASPSRSTASPRRSASSSTCSSTPRSRPPRIPTCAPSPSRRSITWGVSSGPRGSTSSLASSSRERRTTSSSRSRSRRCSRTVRCERTCPPPRCSPRRTSTRTR
mmetsp:Transcript_22087/g.47640  ORF Transcript_22087/g.47640 Transcript_22087/m.47640 type:complete len:330 (-) Transcript_22087:1455-2444(-)